MEGWLVVLALLALVLAGIGVFIHELNAGANPRFANLLFIAWIGVLVGLAILIGWLKGEPPRWHWG